MEVKLENGELFKKIVSSIRELSDEVEFFCDEDTMEVQAMDGSHVCMIDMVLTKNAFSTYEVQQAVSIGVNMANLNSILKMSKKNDSITLKHPKDTDNLELKIAGSKKKIDFKLKLMEIDKDRLQPIELPFTHAISMNSSEFEKVVKDAANIGDSCYINITDNSLDFEVEGDIGSGTISTEDVIVLSDEPLEPLKTRFNTRQLLSIAKSSKLTSNVTLKLGEEFPLYCDYDLGENIGYARFYLAPMNDDEMTGDDDDEE